MRGGIGEKKGSEKEVRDGKRGKGEREFGPPTFQMLPPPMLAKISGEFVPCHRQGAVKTVISDFQRGPGQWTTSSDHK